MSISELFANGGPAMVPLLFLSFLSLSTIIERGWFWSKILTHEREIAGRVIEAARRDWDAATEIARKSVNQPIGRFLHSALDLEDPDPDVFQLALQASADEEIATMRRGEKILEATVALGPLLGLLGTVLGLIRSLKDIRISDLGTDSTAGVTLGISEALISTATGMIVAITALVFYRLFQSFVSSQAKLFRQSGNELELLYRKGWSRSQRQMRYQSPPQSPQIPVIDGPATDLEPPR